MASKSDEQLYTSLHRGMQAAVELTLTRPVIEALKKEAIDTAIAKVEVVGSVQSITEREALLVIVRLAAYERVLTELGNIDKEGRKDGKKLELNA
jgi:hypothetical protein